MSDPYGVSDIMSAGADVQNAWIGTANYLTSLKNQKTQNKYNKINLALQFMQMEYEKQLQQKMFEREDTAVQRRVTDLKAAGLSPVLAAGSAASAGPVINITKPFAQWEEKPMIPKLDIHPQQIAQAASLRSLTDAQEQLVRAQINGQEVNQYLAVRMFPAQYQAMMANAERARAMAAQAWHDYGITARYGIHSHSSTIGGTARDAATIFENLIHRLQNQPGSGGNPGSNEQPPPGGYQLNSPLIDHIDTPSGGGTSQSW